MLKFTQRGVLAPEAFWAMKSVTAQRPPGSWHAFPPLLIRGVPRCHPVALNIMPTSTQTRAPGPAAFLCAREDKGAWRGAR